MPLGDITAHPNWQTIERQEQIRRALGSQRLQLAIVAYGFAALGIAAWRPDTFWLPLLQALLFAAAFLWMPLWTSIYGIHGKSQTLTVTALVLAIVVAIAFLTSPVALHPRLTSISRLSPWLSLLIPLLMTGLLVWSTSRHPGLSHTLGLATRRWGYQAAIGFSLGIAVGLHMWITVRSLPYHWDPEPAPLPTTVWILAISTGLTGLGQEVTLRGALFRMLATESHGLPVAVFVRIIALGAPLYIAPAIYALHGAPLVALTYGIAFAVLALVLRARLRSIAAPLAANIAFHAVMATLMIR